MKRYSKVLGVAGVIIFVIGMVLALNSVNIGMDAASVAIQEAGGSMDTEQFYFIMQSTANAYLVCGAVSALIGGLAAIIFGYVAVKKDE